MLVAIPAFVGLKVIFGSERSTAGINIEYCTPGINVLRIGPELRFAKI
jgi:hypothetical protein